MVSIHATNSCPCLRLMMRPSLESGPHLSISSTFSTKITRGRTARAQVTICQGRQRISLLRTSEPFLALLCSLQSGENHAAPMTRMPPQVGQRATVRGSTSRMSSWWISASGWFALYMASASSSWLTAPLGERPSASMKP